MERRIHGYRNTHGTRDTHGARDTYGTRDTHGTRDTYGTRTAYRFGRSAVTLLLALLLTLTPVFAADKNEALYAVADHAGCSYQKLLESDLVVPGESVSDWLAIAIGCSGDPVKSEAYLQGLEDYVTQQYAENGNLHNIKATEYHRVSLAVLALGGDPTCFGTDSGGNPIDLIAEGTYNWSQSDSLGLQGLNGWIWALIALDAKYYDVPREAIYTREEIVETILMAQSDEGGFGLSSGSPDVDITAMALQALAPYYAGDTRVQGSVDRAVAWLSAHQNENGDFTSWGDTTAEGTAQTIIALCSLGIDPRTDERFIKNGNSAMDGLLRYQLDSGMFRHTMDDEADVMATEQAALALIAVQRLESKGNRLYDLTEVAAYGEQGGGTPVGIIVVSAVVIVAAVAVVFIKRGKKQNV